MEEEKVTYAVLPNTMNTGHRGRQDSSMTAISKRSVRVQYKQLCNGIIGQGLGRCSTIYKSEGHGEPSALLHGVRSLLPVLGNLGFVSAPAYAYNFLVLWAVVEEISLTGNSNTCMYV